MYHFQNLKNIIIIIVVVVVKIFSINNFKNQDFYIRKSYFSLNVNDI